MTCVAASASANNSGEWLAGFDFVAEADEHFEADGEVELVAQLSAAAAEVDDDVAEALGIDGGDVTTQGLPISWAGAIGRGASRSPAWAATISRNFSRPAPRRNRFLSRLRAAATVDSRCGEHEQLGSKLRA